MASPAATKPLGPLAAASGPLVEGFDTVLLDLDGVIYLGPTPIPHAADVLAQLRSQGLAASFVTNNASRTPVQVAAHLTELGVPAEPGDVVSSSMAVARLLRARLPEGTGPVLVCGGQGLREAIEEAGFTLAPDADAAPLAVALGFDPTLDYARLAEAALAVSRGAYWVAANRDATLPSPRGPLPGMGSLVALIATATGCEPVVAGKPELALHEEAVRRSGARCPLIVGDRLDTDIEGAVRAATPSLLVLTGVTDVRELLLAGLGERPTYLAADLRGLLRSHPAASEGRCRSWTAQLRAGQLELSRAAAPGSDPSDSPDPSDLPDSDGLDPLRAAACAVWAARDSGESVDIDQAVAAVAAVATATASAGSEQRP